QRVASRPAEGEQVRQDAVFGYVGLEPGAIDDVMRLDLDCAGVSDDETRQRPVAVRGHLLDHTLHRAVVTALATVAHLLLPRAAPGCVGATHLLVLLGPRFAVQLSHLRFELTAPHGLGVVEALVRPAVAALAAHPYVRAVCSGYEGTKHVHDLC